LYYHYYLPKSHIYCTTPICPITVLKCGDVHLEYWYNYSRWEN
jgi:hypothetical protein